MTIDRRDLLTSAGGALLSSLLLPLRAAAAVPRLRLTGVELRPVRATSRTVWLFVRLLTDTGLIGLGEASDAFGFANTTASDAMLMRRELERFERLRRTYGSVGLTVLGVNLDEEPAQAAALAGAAGIGYPVLMDSAKDVSRSYHADDLPLIVLIDRNGTIRARHQAFDERDERGLLVNLRDLIDE